MAWPKSLNAAGIIEKLKQKIASLQQQWRRTRREIERLRQENEQLRQERERLREENEWLNGNWKKRSGPANDKQLLFPEVGGKQIHSDRGASPAPPTAGVTAKLFPSMSIK
ncbi:MAG: hypothetical protein AUH13_20695 [Acidobacteria bacterium 13_2_20CM_58_27]|nr:MAG: hypothetical protein AUH13_20695 [Acidobacteria bacterium 13_2_20CM_58_27]